MSYILDALRRSQAQREHDGGRVPGLDAQPGLGAAPLPPPRVAHGQRSSWALALGLLGLLGVLSAMFAMFAQGRWAGTVGAAPPLPVSPAAPLGAPPPAPPLALPRVVSAAAPPAQPIDSAVPKPPSQALGAAPARLGTAPASTVQVSPLAEGQPALVPAVVPWASVPADQRREWPPLVLGGSVWSDSAASRFVVINGQIVREGESTEGGVRVERIGPKALQLRYKETRVEMPL